MKIVTDFFFLFKEITDLDLLRVIETINNSHAKDLFNIDPSILKRNKEILVGALTRLVNLSFNKGEFSNNWKRSRVLSIFKSGKAEEVSNYRPISIEPIFSKVLEKIVANQ